MTFPILSIFHPPKCPLLIMKCCMFPEGGTFLATRLMFQAAISSKAFTSGIWAFPLTFHTIDTKYYFLDFSRQKWYYSITPSPTPSWQNLLVFHWKQQNQEKITFSNDHHRETHLGCGHHSGVLGQLGLLGRGLRSFVLDLFQLLLLSTSLSVLIRGTPSTVQQSLSLLHTIGFYIQCKKDNPAQFLFLHNTHRRQLNQDCYKHLSLLSGAHFGVGHRSPDR